MTKILNETTASDRVSRSKVLSFFLSWVSKIQPNHWTIGCNNGIGGFHENLVTYKRPKLPFFLFGSKDAPQKMQFLGAIKKVASLGAFIQHAKMAENPQRFGRHRSKIGPNANVLAYFKSS